MPYTPIRGDPPPHDQKKKNEKNRGKKSFSGRRFAALIDGLRRKLIVFTNWGMVLMGRGKNSKCEFWENDQPNTFSENFCFRSQTQWKSILRNVLDLGSSQLSKEYLFWKNGPTIFSDLCRDTVGRNLGTKTEKCRGGEVCSVRHCAALLDGKGS